MAHDYSVIMTSAEGNFTLVEVHGVTRDYEEWAKLDILRSDEVLKYSIAIGLNAKIDRRRQGPGHEKYVDSYLSCLETSKQINNRPYNEIENYIKLLQEAVDFGQRINSFIEHSDEWGG